MIEFLKTHHRKLMWVVISIICLVAMAYQVVVWDESGYAFNWGGKMFKALSGGALGYLLSRFVLGLDLSTIDVEQRPLAALSQAILIVGFAIAVA